MASRFASDHQALARLTQHTDMRDLPRHGGRLIGAGIVHNQEFVGSACLSEEGMKTCRKIASLIMGADDNAQFQRHACACLIRCRGIPTRILRSVRGACNVRNSQRKRMC
jgi:hypothetical protein